jgi:hypothetical protein
MEGIFQRNRSQKQSDPVGHDFGNMSSIIYNLDDLKNEQTNEYDAPIFEHICENEYTTNGNLSASIMHLTFS